VDVDTLKGKWRGSLLSQFNTFKTHTMQMCPMWICVSFTLFANLKW